MSTVVDTCRDKVKGVLDDLVTVMAAGYDPAVNYAHDHHVVANLKLNAATVDIDPAAQDQFTGAWVDVSTAWYDIEAIIRVHTAYDDGEMDILKNTQLLNSVDNYVNERRNLGGNYRVLRTHSGNPRAEWEDSQSKGGELTVVIQIPVERNQI